MAVEFQTNGITYRSGALDVFAQDALVRRLVPVFGTLIAAYQKFKGGDAAEGLAQGTAAISKLTDADAQFIIRTCLGVVQRKQAPADVWVNVMPSGGAIAFSDITLLDVYELVFHVLRDNLSGFFSGIAQRGLTIPS